MGFQTGQIILTGLVILELAKQLPLLLTNILFVYFIITAFLVQKWMGFSKPHSRKARGSGACFLSFRAPSACYLQQHTPFSGSWAPQLAYWPDTTYWASLHFKSLMGKMESEGRRVLPTFTCHVFKKQKIPFLHGKTRWAEVPESVIIPVSLSKGIIRRMNASILPQWCVKSNSNKDVL